MLTLKVQNKRFNEFSKTDKFSLIPKKHWNLFELGRNKLNINNTLENVTVYELPCSCSGTEHTHRMIDLSGVWQRHNLKHGDIIKLTK